MKTSIVRVIAALAMMTEFAGTSLAAPPDMFGSADPRVQDLKQGYYPVDVRAMKQALVQLQSAKQTMVNEKKLKYGGYRNSAVRLVDQAIDEVRSAIRYAYRH